MEVELTTMCCLLDKKRQCVLMIDRKNSWKGRAFPGGHLEEGEAITDCVKREMKEETGLDLISVQYKGNTYFYNTDNCKKHIIWNFLCDEFTGQLKQQCEEGTLEWVELDKIREGNLAEGMELRFDLFLQPGISELYVEWNKKDGYTNVRKILIS